MSVTDNLIKIRSTLPDSVKLVAVSKFHPEDSIIEVYNAGQRIFGESKVQEITRKFENLPKDIVWHFIGHLQSNKVKYIAPFIELIHSVDSKSLLMEIQKQAAKNNRVIKCLLQIHIASEDSKFGFDENEVLNLLNDPDFNQFKNIKICGLMGMATFTDNQLQIRNEFKRLKSIFENLKKDYFGNDADFCEISIGMSDDYTIAIEEGSTLVRVGSSIFGIRNY